MQRDDLDCLAGGGEMGALMRSFDWSSSPIGPVSGWPQSLRTAVSILLNSRYPMFIFWGPHLAKLYNDGYRPILGAKHPWALGRPGPEVWPEIWDTIGPMVERVVQQAEATWSDDLMLFMHRNGYTEECYFTFSYSPIRDESGGVGGMFCACTETTEKVLGERRLRTLGALAVATAEARTEEDACSRAARILATNAADLPFALLYLFESDGRQARLAAAAGVDAGEPVSPPRVDLGSPGWGWSLGRIYQGDGAEVVDGLGARFGAVPARPWPEPPETALVLPLADRGQDRPVGALGLGISPRRALDTDYRGFLDLVAGQVSAAVANARAYEAERRRAEALAELDRAKTAFFSNVSHEFRTPLTLMLGPLEDLLGQAGDAVPPERREPLEVIHRNGLRLLKLVNTLLDFSRIEAGRVQALYEPTDLATLTAELASTFRSTVERAGLELAVDCPPLSEPVFVDRDMWEKIVLNMVSNAFKFTLEGRIEVSLRPAGKEVELTVRDTGIGIPEEELPRIFERFHRVRGAQGRTYEGTGIGLSLVQELVKLHGGTIEVESREGRGSAFLVRIPVGTEHLPADRIGGVRPLASTAPGAAAFVEEALQWLPEKLRPEPAAALPPPGVSDRPRVLLAEDNADMRAYIRRLLETEYEVDTAADGETALAAARAEPPGLVLTDVMMPGLDGFGLLRELRADLRTRTVPVILLSARAGEESRIEGLEAGADDYLVKPFGARELLARVRVRLEIARIRGEARRVAEAANQAKDHFLATLSHELRTPLTPVLAAVASLERDERFAAARNTLAQIRRNVELEARLIDDLLDLTRIVRGKLELRPEATDLRAVLEHTIQVCCAGEAGRLRLVTDLEAEDLWIWADGSRLTQVFWNLLKNAVKFTPAGGTITVRLRREDEGWLAAEVTDTGRGIDPAALSRIFDAFEQTDPRITREFGGLGLGLAVSRAIVELHGGKLTAASEGEGTGATFTVRLPVGLVPRSEEPRPEAAIRNARPGAARPLHLLLVEDHPDTAEVMAELLREKGHQVTVAGTVSAALAAARAGRTFDVVVSDLGLPDGNGLDLMRELSGRYGLKGIALSGYGMEEDVRRSLEAGFQRHITKPVLPNVLDEVLRDVTTVVEPVTGR
ncbi:MAG TPA: ATP-binding protein [Thermoanaerobaculia bacterium]|nr:ATP-binding protein [Thermoanaerobaculia bacterium]